MIKKLIQKILLKYGQHHADVKEKLLLYEICKKVGFSWEEVASVLIADESKSKEQLEMLQGLQSAISDRMFKLSKTPEMLDLSLKFREEVNEMNKNKN